LIGLLRQISAYIRQGGGAVCIDAFGQIGLNALQVLRQGRQALAIGAFQPRPVLGSLYGAGDGLDNQNARQQQTEGQQSHGASLCHNHSSFPWGSAALPPHFFFYF